MPFCIGPLCVIHQETLEQALKQCSSAAWEFITTYPKASTFIALTTIPTLLITLFYKLEEFQLSRQNLLEKTKENEQMRALLTTLMQQAEEGRQAAASRDAFLDGLEHNIDQALLCVQRMGDIAELAAAAEPKNGLRQQLRHKK